SPSVTFAEPMNAVSVSTAFSVTPPIPGGSTIQPDSSGTIFTCNHAQALSPDAGYTVRIAATATDNASNQLGAQYSFSFTTGAVHDTTRPTIVSTVPTYHPNRQSQNPYIDTAF